MVSNSNSKPDLCNRVKTETIKATAPPQRLHKRDICIPQAPFVLPRPKMNHVQLFLLSLSTANWRTDRSVLSLQYSFVQVTFEILNNQILGLPKVSREPQQSDSSSQNNQMKQTGLTKMIFFFRWLLTSAKNISQKWLLVFQATN